MSEPEAVVTGVWYLCWTASWVALLVLVYNVIALRSGPVDEPQEPNVWKYDETTREYQEPPESHPFELDEMHYSVSHEERCKKCRRFASEHFYIGQ